MNFTLERATSLVAPQWQPQPGTPQVVDGFYLLPVPATNAGAFFRLHGQW